jgi:hypothetical protein
MSSTVCPKCQSHTVEEKTQPIRHLHAPLWLIALCLGVIVIAEFLILFAGIMLAPSLLKVYGVYVFVSCGIIGVAFIVYFAFKYSQARTLFRYTCLSCHHGWYYLTKPSGPYSASKLEPK